MRTALCAIAILGLSACGAPPKPAIEPGPSIPGLNLSGKWYSQEFGDMQIVQTGKNVSGKYEDPRGPDHTGTIRGSFVGDLLRIEWIKGGNPLAAILPVRGKAWLRIKNRGNKLEGRWGYDADDTGGGVWTAEKSQYN